MSRPINNAISKLSYTAEAIFASLVEAGHATSNLKTYNKGGFKKGYSNDVDSVIIEEYDNNLTFEITLNRDSIYDRLPEGLFHQTKGSSKINSVTEAIEEHKQFKEEEKQARKFFAPLEQLLFQYKAAAETAERDTLYDIQNGKLNSSFYKFWNISTDLPETNAGRLLQLMPYCDSIKGNMAATELALSNVLNRKIILKSVQDIDRSFLTKEH
ncbi:hypothetical protein [Niabella ginsengisoli]|uniref:Uncharacterized protein n=1 Tax=Niabella ginsengisoli TaxID=522298 RepID=A0ABS9SGQ7_9BACT|nr:hypothetical protein [Niabella ginsengisoli]MCH5597551.1 hypothetical protein [Niabella ginsengisoli]